MSALTFLLAQAQTSSLSLLERIDDEHLFVVMLVALGCGTGIIIALVAILSGVWSSVRQKQIEAELKQDMLDRGMSSVEIEQVIKARPTEGLDHWMEVWAKKKK